LPCAQTAGALVDCPHAERCGGCALIALPLEAQHSFKSERVQRALQIYPPLASLQPAELRAADPATHYRTRPKLVVSPEGAIGLFGRGGHDVIDIPECRVLSPLLAEVVSDLRAQLTAAGRTALTAIDLREVRDGSERGVLLTLIGPPARRAQLEAL